MNVATDTDLFETFVDNHTAIIDGVEINKWQMYEFLKQSIPRFDVEYETAIKMITDRLEV